MLAQEVYSTPFPSDSFPGSCTSDLCVPNARVNHLLSQRVHIPDIWMRLRPVFLPAKFFTISVLIASVRLDRGLEYTYVFLGHNGRTHTGTILLLASPIIFGSSIANLSAT